MAPEKHSSRREGSVELTLPPVIVVLELASRKPVQPYKACKVHAHTNAKKRGKETQRTVFLEK